MRHSADERDGIALAARAPTMSEDPQTTDSANARRVLVGRDAQALDALQRLLPASYQRVVVAAAKRQLSKVAQRAEKAAKPSS